MLKYFCDICWVKEIAQLYLKKIYDIIMGVRMDYMDKGLNYTDLNKLD